MNSIKRFNELLLNHVNSLNNQRNLTADLALLTQNWLILEMIEHFATLINNLRPNSRVMTL